MVRRSALLFHGGRDMMRAVAKPSSNYQNRTVLKTSNKNQSGEWEMLWKRQLISATAVMLVTAGCLGFVLAPGTASAEGRVLEEIIVTARKKEESLQDVPVVVQAFDSAALEAYATNRFEDLSDLVSGLSILSEGAITPSVNLRGVQTSGTSSIADNSVSTVFDGVPYSGAHILNYGLFDAEAVEVLKGPQALFFGKNSPGGVIAVRTKDPTDELFTELRTGHEFEGTRSYGHAIVSGPFDETWGGRLAVRVSSQDGYFDNVWGRGDPEAVQPVSSTGPNYDEFQINGTLRGEFDRGDVTIKILHATREGKGHYAPYQFIECDGRDLSVPGNPTGLNPFTDCSVDKKFATAPFMPTDAAPTTLFSNREPFTDNELTQVSIDANLDINDTWSVNSITGWVDLQNSLLGNSAPGSNNDFGIAYGSTPSIDKISQEIRFTGEFDRATVMLGAFADNRENFSQTKLWINPSFALTPDTEFGTDSESWSVFAQVNYDLTEAVNLSVGGRYTSEERSLSARNNQANTGFPRRSIIGAHRFTVDELSYQNFSPELIVSWQAADDVNLYAGYREAFKSGGFSPSSTRGYPTVDPSVPAIDVSYEEENAEGFEVGAKTEWLGNSLRVNVAAFSFEYSDLQQSAFDGAEVRTINAGIANVEGVEMDVLWVTPIDGLTVNGNVAFNNNEFDDFLDGCNDFQIFVAQGDCNVNADGNLETWADGNRSTAVAGIIASGADVQDRSGHPLRRAPEWSGSVGFTYERQISESMIFTANGLAIYSDEYQTEGENNPLAIQDAYWIINAGIGIEATDGGWQLNLIGRNLTDEAYVISAFETPRSGSNSAGLREILSGMRNPPRQVFLELTVRPGIVFGR